MEFVYPKLREFCQKKGYDFQVICQTTIFNNRQSQWYIPRSQLVNFCGTVQVMNTQMIALTFCYIAGPECLLTNDIATLIGCGYAMGCAWWCHWHTHDDRAVSARNQGMSGYICWTKLCGKWLHVLCSLRAVSLLTKHC